MIPFPSSDEFSFRLGELKKALDSRENDILSPMAARSNRSSRRRTENRLASSYRQDYAVDGDRILHSLAYTRYIDKTQVFYLVRNDHITHRVLHVQLVSKVARTIGRFLGLNEDLMEAIALGHDIGHPPFGHEGENFLSRLCLREGIGHFHHNVQSVRFMESVERKGLGWNLCLQTLDGILCHDGETHNRRLEPQWDKTFATLDQEMAAKTTQTGVALRPMTLEGCVVRMADTISYIGRDIEDAIRLGLITRKDLPGESVQILGDTNGTIVYQLVTDVIANSVEQPYLAFSPEVSHALKTLKKFNYDRIYLNPKIKRASDTIGRLYEYLFDSYLEDIRKENLSSVIYTHFLESMSSAYLENRLPAEIVRDFIAGMTDGYFLAQCPESMRPTILENCY
ncbi:MAG: deoxyguanosinetriphosphate triphosphohydrolase family protein [Thermodesulfobacteriota bacterium]